MSPRRRAVHVLTEALSVAVVSPVLLVASARLRPRSPRLAVAVALAGVAGLVVDGALLALWERDRRRRRGRG